MLAHKISWKTKENNEMLLSPGSRFETETSEFEA